MTPAKSKVSTLHCRLFDLLYFVSTEKQNLSLADSALHSLLQTLLRYSASFIKGLLLLLNVNVLLNFPKFQEEVMWDATQGDIQMAAEVKSLDYLGSPGGEVCYWLRCSMSPLKYLWAFQGPAPPLTQCLRARNTSRTTTLFLPLTGFSPSNSHRATPNSSWCKSDLNKTSLYIITVYIYYMGYKNAFFFSC